MGSTLPEFAEMSELGVWEWSKERMSAIDQTSTREQIFAAQEEVRQAWVAWTDRLRTIEKREEAASARARAKEEAANAEPKSIVPKRAQTRPPEDHKCKVCGTDTVRTSTRGKWPTICGACKESATNERSERLGADLTCVDCGQPFKRNSNRGKTPIRCSTCKQAPKTK